MDITGTLEDEARELAAVGDSILRPQRVIPGTQARDVLRGTQQDDEIDARGGNDDVRGRGGNDVVTGGGGNDILRGGAGDDDLDGGGGNDRLLGQRGIDTLSGGRGRDQLLGGGGADLLDGKAGQDVMAGGGGADVFAFSVLDGNADRILDFVQGKDRLDLSAILPDFGPGDDLDLFVDLDVIPEGTVLSVDPTGAGDFDVLAGLEGVSVEGLEAGDLGLPGGLPSEPTVVSTNAAGVAANATAFAPSLSNDGTFVTFSSLADNLVADDDNDAFDVFRKDLTTGEVVRVSQEKPSGQSLSSMHLLSVHSERSSLSMNKQPSAGSQFASVLQSPRSRR